MIPEIGQFALIIALFLALTQAILPLYGTSTRQPDVDGARGAA